MADQPYAPVVEALLKQTRAINQLARELKEEAAQFQNAVKSRDNKRAQAIADAINKRTARLVEATEALEASTPDAEVGGGPAEGRPGVDNALPGDQPGVDNTLPGRDRPTDPDFGVDEGGRPVAPDQPPQRPDRPDQGLPPAQGRPDQGLPDRERPTDPDFGVDADRPNRPGNALPGEQPGVDNELPVAPDSPPDRPNPADSPVLEYLAPSNATVGESITFDVSGKGFLEDATAYLDDEPATETIFVNANMVRVKKTFSTAGTVQVTVDGSNALPLTVN